MLDLLICGAGVYVGDRGAIDADVGVTDGRIAAVGRELSESGAREVIRADGLVLTPGFIDMHAHTALQPFVDPLLAPKIGQGFTTEVINPDGLVPAPVSEDRVDDRRAYLMPIEGAGPECWEWGTYREYLDALDRARPVTSLVPSVGHGAIRDHVVGAENRPPTEEELERMRAEVRAQLAEGARMLSFGLIYAPGMYADTDELIALAREAAVVGAPLVPHVRDEADGVLDAVGEFVAVAEASGAPLHLSHLKVLGHPELIQPLLELIDDAAGTIDISFDQYPYGAGSTTLSAQLPPWALEGGAAHALRLLTNAESRERIVRDIDRGLPGWQNFLHACGADAIVVAHAAGGRRGDRGKSLADIAAERETTAPEAVVDLLVDAQLEVLMIPHFARDEHVAEILRHPLMLVGSDGIFGPHPHPRLYGTAARVLGDLAIRQDVISTEEAVARLTSRAADRLRLSDRGRIQEGLRADLVLLDPATLADRSDYETPAIHPSGIERVLVAGQTVWADGAPTGARPGGVVRQPLRSADSVSGSGTR